MPDLVKFRIDFEENPHRLPWGMEAERVPVVGESIVFQKKKFEVESVEFNCDYGTDRRPPLLQCKLLES